MFHLKLALLAHDPAAENKPASFPEGFLQIWKIEPDHRKFPALVSDVYGDDLSAPHGININAGTYRSGNGLHRLLLKLCDIYRRFIFIIISWIVVQEIVGIVNTNLLEKLLSLLSYTF